MKASAPLTQVPQKKVPFRAIGFLSVAAFASAATTRVTDLLLPAIAGDFATSAGAASIVVTAYALAYGVCQLAFGPLGDRYGKYRMVLIAACLNILTAAACGFAASLPMLTLARLASGVTAAALIPLSMAWIGDVVDYHHRQSVLARYLSGQILGLIAGQATGGAIGQHWGWRAVFFVVAAIYALAAAGLSYEFSTNPATRTSPAREKASARALFADLSALLRAPFVRAVLLAVFVDGFCIMGAFAYAGVALRQHFAASFGVIGWTLALFGLGGLGYVLFAGRLVAAFGEARLFRLGGLSAALAFVAFAFAPSATWAAAPVALAGFGFYMLHNTLQANATQMAPERRGGAVSLFAACFFTAQSLGVAAAAPVVDRYGASPVFAFSALCIAALALVFGARLARKHAAAIAAAERL